MLQSLLLSGVVAEISFRMTHCPVAIRRAGPAKPLNGRQGAVWACQCLLGPPRAHHGRSSPFFSPYRPLAALAGSTLLEWWYVLSGLTLYRTNFYPRRGLRCWGVLLFLTFMAGLCGGGLAGGRTGRRRRPGVRPSTRSLSFLAKLSTGPRGRNRVEKG